MVKKLLLNGIGWGIGLWFVGYALGILLFFIIPKPFIGWVILPVGTLLTVFVLVKKIKERGMAFYFLIGLTWTAIAIIFDYFFLVRLFKTGTNYYQLDVFVYYLLTFCLPVIVGWKKNIHPD